MGARASAPLRRKKRATKAAPAPPPAPAPALIELAIISDPGEDLDDELAMVFLRHLTALYPSLVSCGCDLGAADDVWALVVGFNLYDVIALLACCPALRTKYLEAHAVDVKGVRHQVIGRGDAATGVRDADALRRALADGIRDGIARGTRR